MCSARKKSVGAFCNVGEVGIATHLTDFAAIRSRCWCRCRYSCRCRYRYEYKPTQVQLEASVFGRSELQHFCLQLEHVCFGCGSCWPLAINLQPAALSPQLQLHARTGRITSAELERFLFVCLEDCCKTLFHIKYDMLLFSFQWYMITNTTARASNILF